MFTQKPTPHPSGPPPLQLQETLSFLPSLRQKAWDLEPCKVSPGSTASPRLRRQKKPEHAMVSLVWLAPAHSSRPLEGGLSVLWTTGAPRLYVRLSLQQPWNLPEPHFCEEPGFH